MEDVKRLRDLVEDLMEISTRRGHAAGEAERVDLGSLVGTAVRARGWQERVHVDADRLVLVTDPRRVERIVANLVGTLSEHGGREVAVRVGRDGLRAFVEVADPRPGLRAKTFRTCSSASTRPIRRARAAAPGSGSVALRERPVAPGRHRGPERAGVGTVSRSGCLLPNRYPRERRRCERPAGLTHRVVQGGDMKALIVVPGSSSPPSGFLVASCSSNGDATSAGPVPSLEGTTNETSEEIPTDGRGANDDRFRNATSRPARRSPTRSGSGTRTGSS